VFRPRTKLGDPGDSVYTSPRPHRYSMTRCATLVILRTSFVEYPRIAVGVAVLTGVILSPPRTFTIEPPFRCLSQCGSACSRQARSKRSLDSAHSGIRWTPWVSDPRPAVHIICRLMEKALARLMAVSEVSGTFGLYTFATDLNPEPVARAANKGSSLTLPGAAPIRHPTRRSCPRQEGSFCPAPFSTRSLEGCPPDCTRP
jgi:hypothetical protein